MEINDIAGLGKLGELVSNAVGTLYKPKALRNEADAEAYRIRAIARADQDKALIEQETQHTLEERSAIRVKTLELKRQLNLESIAEKAEGHLTEPVSNEPVDPDWRTRFFQKAQDVSHEDLQEIWAKILASEVSKPGTVSLRTLDIISNVSKQEAEIFKKVLSIVSNHEHIWRIGEGYSFEGFDLSYDEILKLREAGLIIEGDNLVAILPVGNIASLKTTSSFITIGKTMYKLYKPSDPRLGQYAIPQICLSTSGNELSKMINADFNEAYTDALINSLRREGYTIERFGIK